MALVNAQYELATYTDDFGGIIQNVPVKFGDDVPATILTTFYQVRSGGVSCGIGRVLNLRRLKATFASGAIHEFPINERSFAVIRDRVGTLLSNGAICVELVGERWNVVPPGKFNPPIDFTANPWTNIPSRAKRQSISFEYEADIFEQGAISLSTSIEIDPQDLNACQKAGLSSASIVGGSICPGSQLGIKPRKLIIQARAVKTGDASDLLRRVIRDAKISSRTPQGLLAVAPAIGSCGECVGYKGEDATNLELQFAAAPSQ